MSGTVLVTGGLGYIGSATCHAMDARGRKLVVLDDLSTGHASFGKWGPHVHGDIADEALVSGVIDDYGVTAIVHFAAKALVGESVRDPELYDRWNRQKTTTLVQLAKRKGIQAFVFSSTCAVYGEPDKVPITEDTSKAPVNPYGASKLACEAAIRATGIPHALLRYFNAAGGVPEAGVGEDHDPETHLIPLALRAAKTGQPLTIFGNDYPTQDGTCVRDYIHVRDLAAAHIAALEHLESGGSSGAWNLGTGTGVSVQQLVDACAQILGIEIPYVMGERREGDPPELVADPTAAARDLGWRATQSSLEQILRDAHTFELQLKS